ncbi:MAG TPA: NTP transferase domain-containing protein [Acidimicrobiales bacterium]|nr:NTP transferase domain-containing protein [Acidimicrobiales bacterium]
MGRPLAFDGAVLCGGASRRMGRDKALIALDGRALALRVADALAAAGAERVVAVGGDAAALGALGLATVPDEAPGSGPLTGIVTALRTASAPVVLVAACDLTAPSPDALAATVAALAADARADVAVPVVGGRRQWVHAAWRRSCGPPLVDAFAVGERAVHAAVARAALRVTETAVDARAVADADTPADLPGRTG